MKEDKDYIKDIAEIRSMMERTSKFLSLSGWAGIMAGIYALLAAFIAYKLFEFNPDRIAGNAENDYSYPYLIQVIFLAVATLVLAVATAIFFSWKDAVKRGVRLWNNTSKRMLINMAVPLVAGGLLILVLLSNGMIGLIAPLTLLFYGLALFNAGNFTFEEVKYLGLIQVALGLAGCLFINHGLLFWAFGFGITHILYGIYLHYRYKT